MKYAALFRRHGWHGRCRTSSSSTKASDLVDWQVGAIDELTPENREKDWANEEERFDAEKDLQVWRLDAAGGAGRLR
ncbi:hypothetical protein E5843_09185 [Luteimonas yindakuii]|uniref:hypothetical protein n=1 Tax=Luteimonas yindakuii TaxID=2565782 RepID=UPI0010A37FF9|nr:hypothetical protein [Luteimonas yindakuii]QCO67892.1 hypothetical protein E5843_09185 [Luteimonas yindakuii]